MGEVFRVSNTDVAPRDRFDVWRDRVQHLLHPMDVQPASVGDPAGFIADFRAVRAVTTAAAVGQMSPVAILRVRPWGDWRFLPRRNLLLSQTNGYRYARIVKTSALTVSAG